MPLVANGEIWTVEDALRCQQVSGCTSLMLGRGMVADPGLALAIRAALGQGARHAAEHEGEIGTVQNFEQKSASALDWNELFATKEASRPGSACGFTAPVSTRLPPHVPWADVQPLLMSFWHWVEQRVERRHRAGRLKQWLNLLRRRYPEAQAAFDELRTISDADVLSAWLRAQQRG